MTIIDQFLDVDFRTFPQYVKGYDSFGHTHGYRAYEDSVNIIPESQWAGEVDAMTEAGNSARALVTRIYDQGQEGSCVANATSQAHEIVQALQFGKERVTHLSAISLYKRIGRSPGSGAMVSDGMDEGAARGILPLDNEENRAKFGESVMPNTGFYEKYPDNWEETAKEFRFDEIDVITSLAEMMTALIRRQPVVVGRQGHSICYAGLIRRSGSYVAEYPNSWRDTWGDNGWGYDSLSQIRLSSGWAFTVRSIITPKHTRAA